MRQEELLANPAHQTTWYATFVSEALPHYWHLLDQDSRWIDRSGNRWPVDNIPARTAAQLLDSLRGSALTLLTQHARDFDAARDEAIAFGETGIDPALEADSVPFYDECCWLEFAGGEGRIDEQKAIALRWLETTPLVRALRTRATSAH